MTKQYGFSLVELVTVIVILGIIGASLTVFFVPAMQAYRNTQNRADLSSMADVALRRVAQDVRMAVPNSLRVVTPQCFQLVPVTAGGRYRLAVDTTLADTRPIDGFNRVTSFDVLSPLQPAPQRNDWVVISNLTGDDVYLGRSRYQLDAAPAALPANAGTWRFNVNPPVELLGGRGGGRFMIVSNNEQTVIYSCQDGFLRRNIAQFGADQNAICAAPAGDIVASDVADCQFTYDEIVGATQQNAFMSMRLQLERDGEQLEFLHGAHVVNAS